MSYSTESHGMESQFQCIFVLFVEMLLNVSTFVYM